MLKANERALSASARADELREPLNQFPVRMAQELLTAAFPWSWWRRAETLDAARPRPGDFHGRATADELAERDRRLSEEAEQCRVHARFLTDNPDAVAEIIAADVESLMLTTAEGVSRDGNLT